MPNYAKDYYCKNGDAYMYNIINGRGHFDDGLWTEKETQGEGLDIAAIVWASLAPNG
jgi:hypothetical protein